MLLAAGFEPIVPVVHPLAGRSGYLEYFDVGIQYADICEAEIEYAGLLFKSSEHEFSQWYLEQEIRTDFTI